MFVIESTNAKGWRWLSGVFEHQQAAERELNSIAPEVRHFHRIVQTPTATFPLFIIEDRGFAYVDINRVFCTLASTQPRGDDDHIHFNIYAVRREFKPSESGTDEMGLLLHWHITDTTLRQPRARVFRKELAEIASDA
ncbi:hypothetical protein [Piscinibacter defluvii]|uniref:hypothetical protein n=1 Tax=Piscinibacter defluvii TaxID=1796922 RepID=UPI000FDF409F|nr:hypothetical protein [Piscinibacter defluvii]